MPLTKAVLASLALSVASAAAAEYDDMGPAAFMWPPDRVWDAAVDNNAPCGSNASPSNRTEFPMQNGQVALVGQDESWDVELSISYSDDPQSDDDFQVLIDAMAFREMERGHTCVPVSASPDSVTAGDFATLQVKYIADFDSSDNQTFYACADITFVELASFDVEVPCFNATVPEDEDGAGPDYDFHDKDGDEDEKDNEKESSPSETPDADSSEGEPDEGSPSGGSDKLSGGEIAGIVVGSIAGVALIAGAALFLDRRNEQKKRATSRDSRGIKWDEQPGKDSVSNSSVRMQNLSP